MPDTLKLTVRAEHTPTDAQQSALDTGLMTQTVNLAGDIVSGPQSQSIGLVEEQIALPPDIGNDAYLVIRNLDDANFVNLGYTTGVYPEKIGPGLFKVCQLQGAPSIFVLADTADCKIQYWFVNA